MSKQPLYCFKVNPDTGEITTFTITEYQERTNIYNDLVSYRWVTPRINTTDRFFVTYNGKLDKFTGNKVYSFNPDKQHAVGIMKATLEKKIEEYQKTEKRWQDILHRLNVSEGE